MATIDLKFDNLIGPTMAAAVPIVAATASKSGSGTRNRHTNTAASASSNQTSHVLSRRRKRELWTRIDAGFVCCNFNTNTNAPDVTDEVMSSTGTAIDDRALSANANAIECIYRTSGLREFCDACGTIVSITDEGFTACSNPACSIIYKDVLDHTAEWRYYGADSSQLSDPTRCGMPVNPLLVESSYGCKVLCDGPSTYEMRKIRRYSEWQAMPYREKAQYDEFQRITIVAHNNEIPKIIIDEALRHHKRISEHKTFRGLNRDGVIAASVYVACRIHNCPRTAKEIATIFSLDITSATRGCKNALVIINELECDMVNSDKTAFCKTTPNAFIERYCSRLNMNMELTQVCLFVASRIEKRQLIPENTPHSIAAGIVYFIAQTCGLNISKRDVNRVSEISEVTINKCFKKLDTHLNDLIPKTIISKYIS